MLKILVGHMMNHHMVATAGGGSRTSRGPHNKFRICPHLYFLIWPHIVSAAFAHIVLFLCWFSRLPCIAYLFDIIIIIIHIIERSV